MRLLYATVFGLMCGVLTGAIVIAIAQAAVD